MMKKIVAVLMCFYSALTFACPNALPTNDVNFCSSFKTAASCHCTSSGLPSSMCQDMNALYNRMILLFGSLRKACEYQHHTSTQDCINSWTCYRQGGADSNGLLCSSTGRPCQ